MKIYNQNTFDKWPVDDNSIQAIITSPPYWGLRKYDITDASIGNWQGQYGLEPSHMDYIEHTRLWVKEAWRVLRDDGIFFLNLGDSYFGGGKGNGSGKLRGIEIPKGGSFVNKRTKCKALIPHRVAIALIDDGWILRNDIVWHKPNAMPESCKNRFSKKFEYIFMFTKSRKYYFDLDTIREPHKQASIKRWGNGGEQAGNTKYRQQQTAVGNLRNASNPLNVKGKNPGDIWQINTRPSPEKHFAMWPETLVERMILCSTKTGDTVLDPFCGSATTIRVAEQLNRDGVGIDLGYQDIQKRRLANIQPELPWQETHK